MVQQSLPLIQRQRARRTWPSLPAAPRPAAMSHYDRSRGRRQAMNPFLESPVTLNEICAAVADQFAWEGRPLPAPPDSWSTEHEHAFWDAVADRLTPEQRAWLRT